jgi:hypothetical protein
MTVGVLRHCEVFFFGTEKTEKTEAIQKKISLNR